MTSDQPWPEIPAPIGEPHDGLEVLREHKTRVVWGEGDPGASLMIVLDNPGAREDRDGRPFVCPTRITLRRALNEAHIDSNNVYVTYLLKRRPTRAYDRAQAWEAYKPILEQQVRDACPRVLVLAGNVLVHALIDPVLDVKGLRGRSLEVFDLPAIVTYHPLAARRRPAIFPMLVEDLARATSL